MRLWWKQMESVCLRKLFDCALDYGNETRPAPGTVFDGAPIWDDNLARIHCLEKAEKIGTALELTESMNDAQLEIPICRSCLTAVLFFHIFRTTRPEQTASAVDELDAQQTRWIDRLLPNLPSLSRTGVRQARLPIREAGLGHTALSEVVLLAYLASRCDTAARIASLPRLLPTAPTMAD